MKNNENAFPQDIWDRYTGSMMGQEKGMTLRDYFAAKALSLIPFLAKDVCENPEIWNSRAIAHEAYQIADSMLEERTKNQ